MCVCVRAGGGRMGAWFFDSVLCLWVSVYLLGCVFFNCYVRFCIGFLEVVYLVFCLCVYVCFWVFLYVCCWLCGSVSMCESCSMGLCVGV